MTGYGLEGLDSHAVLEDGHSCSSKDQKTWSKQEWAVQPESFQMSLARPEDSDTNVNVTK